MLPNFVWIHMIFLTLVSVLKCKFLFQKSLARLEEKAHKAVGHAFLLNSHHQLRQVINYPWSLIIVPPSCHWGSQCVLKCQSVHLLHFVSVPLLEQLNLELSKFVGWMVIPISLFGVSRLRWQWHEDLKQYLVSMEKNLLVKNTTKNYYSALE